MYGRCPSKLAMLPGGSKPGLEVMAPTSLTQPRLATCITASFQSSISITSKNHLGDRRHCCQKMSKASIYDICVVWCMLMQRLCTRLDVTKPIRSTSSNPHKCPAVMWVWPNLSLLELHLNRKLNQKMPRNQLNLLSPHARKSSTSTRSTHLSNLRTHGPWFSAWSSNVPLVAHARHTLMHVPQAQP